MEKLFGKYKNVLELFENGTDDEVLKFISEASHEYSPNEELALIKRGDHELVMAFIKKHRLRYLAQIKFIERGNEEEIIFYIFHYYLCNEAEISLITRGKINEIAIYTHNFILSEEAQELLEKQDFYHDYLAYCMNGKYYEDLVKRNNEEELITMLQNVTEKEENFIIWLLKHHPDLLFSLSKKIEF